MPRFAKYQHAHHPAMRRMLVEGRCQAMEKALGLLRIRFERTEDSAQRQHLTEKMEQVKEQIARLRRLMAAGGES